MKHRFILAAVAVLAALLFCCACGRGGNNPADGAPDASIPANYDETAADTYATLLNEMNSIAQLDQNTFVRGVVSADALPGVLQNDKDAAVELKTAEEKSVEIPAGDYTGKTLVLNAENAEVVCNGEVGTVAVNALGEKGLSLLKKVGKLAVYGEDVNVELADGADNIYVSGKNCTLRLTGGEFGTIMSVNQTVKIMNETDHDVTVMMANGAPQILPAGETLSFTD